MLCCIVYSVLYVIVCYILIGVKWIGVKNKKKSDSFCNV